MKNNSSGSSGIGFCGLLTILFIALRLTGFISWAWIWVVSPIWLSLAFWLILLILVTILRD